MPVNMTPARKCRLSFYNPGSNYIPLGLICDNFDFESHERKLYQLSMEIKQE
jgi:hypothetical protein